jgi:hypothetical protein
LKPIVDAALLFGRPFAVVPCCVFPSFFSERRLDGKSVVSYDQFMEYLKAKVIAAGRECELAFLPFKGTSQLRGQQGP